MPLLDHFHPPVSSLDAWVNFHGLWASTILMHLNGRVLPMPYKSQQQIHVGPNIVIDVATFEQQEEESLFSGYDPSGNGDGEGGVATLPQVYAPPGGVGADAEQELSGRVPASAAVATGRAQSHHGDGALAGADRVQHDALRRRLSEAERRGVHE